MKYFLLVFAALIVQNSDGQIKTFSTSEKTSKYTECFNNYYDSAKNLLANKIANMLYTTQGLKQALKKEGDGFLNDSIEMYYDTSLLIERKTLAPGDKKNLEDVLNNILRKIHSVTVADFPELKTKASLFKCKLTGTGLNLLQPEKPAWTLDFHEDILVNIYKRSLVDIFALIDSSEDSEFNVMIDDADFATPVEYLNEIRRSQTYWPPCLPVLRRKEFLYLLSNKAFRKKGLPADDIEELNDLKKGIEGSDFWGSLLCNCSNSEYADILIESLDITKLPPDLQALFKKVKLNKNLTDRFIEHAYENWIKGQLSLFLISRYVSLEILKYVVFSIAHESYHAWFVSGLPGKEHELKADAFATYIYLRFFTDKKIIHEFVKETNSFLQGVVADDDSGTSDEEWNKMLKPFIGRSITEIFGSLLKTTAFYEKQESYHPPFSERITAIEKIVSGSLDSEAALAELKEELVTIFIKYKNKVL